VRLLQSVFHPEENQTTVRREVSPLIWVLSVLFILRYAFLGSE
jgi:hypothetical protein